MNTLMYVTELPFITRQLLEVGGRKERAAQKEFRAAQKSEDPATTEVDNFSDPAPKLPLIRKFDTPTPAPAETATPIETVPATTPEDTKPQEGPKAPDPAKKDEGLGLFTKAILGSIGYRVLGQVSSAMDATEKQRTEPSGYTGAGTR